MSNQVVIPFPQQHREAPRTLGSPALLRAKILSRLSTVRGVVKAVFETLSYMGDARVKRPLLPASSLPGTK